MNKPGMYIFSAAGAILAANALGQTNVPVVASTNNSSLYLGASMGQALSQTVDTKAYRPDLPGTASENQTPNPIEAVKDVIDNLKMTRVFVGGEYRWMYGELGFGQGSAKADDFFTRGSGTLKGHGDASIDVSEVYGGVGAFYRTQALSDRINAMLKLGLEIYQSDMDVRFTSHQTSPSGLTADTLIEGNDSSFGVRGIAGAGLSVNLTDRLSLEAGVSLRGPNGYEAKGISERDTFKYKGHETVTEAKADIAMKNAAEISGFVKARWMFGKK